MKETLYRSPRCSGSREDALDKEGYGCSECLGLQKETLESKGTLLEEGSYSLRSSFCQCRPAVGFALYSLFCFYQFDGRSWENAEQDVSCDPFSSFSFFFIFDVDSTIIEVFLSRLHCRKWRRGLNLAKKVALWRKTCGKGCGCVCVCV